MKWIILLLLLCSCGTLFEKEYSIIPEAERHVEKFYAEAAQRGQSFPRELIVEFAALDSGMIGFGNIATPWKSAHVRLDKTFVYNALAKGTHEDSMRVQTLVLHELGHALMRRSHVNTYSLMNIEKHQWNYAKYDSSKITLLNELFTK